MLDTIILNRELPAASILMHAVLMHAAGSHTREVIKVSSIGFEESCHHRQIGFSICTPERGRKEKAEDK